MPKSIENASNEATELTEEDLEIVPGGYVDPNEGRPPEDPPKDPDPIVCY
jgi:hypothetical protein